MSTREKPTRTQTTAPRDQAEVLDAVAARSSETKDVFNQDCLSEDLEKRFPSNLPKVVKDMAANTEGGGVSPGRD